ncbi:MAG TPA: nitroreductase family protein [Candidatus Dormibacteraeota bacterium]|nr:nitroreductase family protein [Candidatus Dormibacteraeota bacterium]
MEFADLVRRRRMVHHFASRPVPQEVLDTILESARHAPSAGFSQGLALIVLDDREQLAWFWRATQQTERPQDAPPVVVLPVPDKRVYLERYQRPDKGGPQGPRATESGWPTPYFWDVDAAMACMLILLKAVDLGIGAWFFGIPYGHDELVQTLGVPEGLRVIGAIGLGYQADGDRMEGSSVTIPRRELSGMVHRGGW